ncbi:MAG: 2Fe-2S iron-sulfur cluster binding domain-containing protein [Rhodopseudomonas palustris]|uniref:2Fe-2S iron-sulfur cluster binding domain-containing protein n=1 Tax=Rhodopseudomonas palustris TaxID=1076 RepID=A0A933VUM2_RHOPL|nr:2Fe-2S iron-sulfur cluster binding domain-containing protein [Rhodopseudomonas palustris]
MELIGQLDDEINAAVSFKVSQADSHSAHHPDATTSDESRSRPTNSAAAPLSDNSSGMMGDMMSRPRKEIYPSLMEMPPLSAEERRRLEAQAHTRADTASSLISADEMELRHAIAAGNTAAADQALRRIRDALNEVESGVTILRSLNEGSPPQMIGLNWFKAQMSRFPRAMVWSADGLLGISWFHVLTMTLLAIFSGGMLAVFVARMRRANALVQRLTTASTPISVSGQTAALSLMPDIVAPADRVERAPGRVLSAAPPIETVPRVDRGDVVKPRGLWKGKLKVCAIFKETPNVKTFRLQTIDGAAIPFSFVPGQFLTYSAEIDGKTVQRSYTIASSAAQTAYVETTIKREDGGVFSDYMHDNVKPGNILDVMAPSGSFTFTGQESDNVVLIGGGVGITPLMAAIRYLSDIAWPGHIHLVYGAQSTEQFIFRDELEYLQRRMDNLHVAATMARAAGTSWMGSEGQITAEFLERSVPDVAKRRVHLCGPPGMMEALRKTLRDLGVPSEQIKTEAFGPAKGAVPPPGIAVIRSPSPPAALGSMSAAIGPATASVRFTKSNKIAPLPPDKSVLEVAETVGVPIDFSCRSGICGLCKTHLLEGDVTMEVQEALTDQDRANGMILACQAKSISSLVVEA